MVRAFLEELLGLIKVIVMIDLIVACFIGIGCGTLTGMVPGIHVNTAGAIMFASSAFLLEFISPEFLCVILVAMSITHALIECVKRYIQAQCNIKVIEKELSNYQ